MKFARARRVPQLKWNRWLSRVGQPFHQQSDAAGRFDLLPLLPVILKADRLHACLTIFQDLLPR